ncbi:serine hydrolase domain-containing protein [Catenulispora rubra]|uniref:serine hydrolase domain-containing protein n=1 Tax=Catenulispora rubra TaxID=280293 RepID=UPI0018923C08|nr:serine hydrolase domain-containing protein [Catenulispora rubra]
MFGHLRFVAACAAVAGLLAVSATTATAAGAAGPATHDPGPGLQQELEALVHEPGGPPGVIVTFKSHGVTSVYRAGVADLTTGRPPEPYDAMRIASVSKAYSGAVALMLAGWGVLGLDDTIARWLPTLPAAWGQVTLRELLQHTSGLPDYSAEPAFHEVLIADPHHVFAPNELLSFAASQPLRFAPGTRYQYSNSDNIAVALMTAAATGRKYEQLLNDLLYVRLGLYRTSLPKGYKMPPYYMHGYGVRDGLLKDVSTEFSASASWASGGIVSTPRELNAFIAAYAGPRLLSERTRQAQLTFIAGGSEPPGPGTNAAGLGIFRYSTRCGVVYGHTGNTSGYTQFAAASPDGTHSMTFSVNAQITPSSDQTLFDRMRKVEEDAVCALLSH